MPKLSEKADGYYHTRVSIAFAAPVAVIAAFVAQGRDNYWLDVALAAFGCGGLGCIMTPDLDIESNTYAKTNLRKIPVIGTGLYLFWYYYWLPYGKLNPHRGTSHTLRGSLERMAYVLPLTVPLWLILNISGYSLISFNTIESLLFLCFELLVSDLGHILRDKYGLTL